MKGRDPKFSKRPKWRKFGGWLVGSYGVIAFILSILTVILLCVGIYLGVEESKNMESADMLGGAVMGCLVTLAIIGAVIFAFSAAFQVLKIISGVFTCKGKRKLAVMVLTMIGIGGSVSFIFITGMIGFMMSPLVAVFFILLGLLDLAIWAFMIWVLVYTWETFEEDKRNKKKTKDLKMKKQMRIVWEE